MSVDGTVYSRGFGAHAPARIAVAPPAGLQGKQGILRFGLGIDDQTQGAGSVAITVCLVD